MQRHMCAHAKQQLSCELLHLGLKLSALLPESHTLHGQPHGPLVQLPALLLHGGLVGAQGVAQVLQVHQRVLQAGNVLP